MMSSDGTGSVIDNGPDRFRQLRADAGDRI